MPGKGSIVWLSWAKYRKKLKLILQSNEMLSKKIVPLDAEGGVKVLSEKMGSDEHFQNCSVGPESILIILAFWAVRELQTRFQLIIRSRFRILPPDDWFPKFRVWIRKRFMDMRYRRVRTTGREGMGSFGIWIWVITGRVRWIAGSFGR